MTARELADALERRDAEDISFWWYYHGGEIVRTLREQADEIACLKAEMSVHETPDGGVAGMLTIDPKVVEAWKEREEE